MQLKMVTTTMSETAAYAEEPQYEFDAETESEFEVDDEEDESASEAESKFTFAPSARNTASESDHELSPDLPHRATTAVAIPTTERAAEFYTEGKKLKRPQPTGSDAFSPKQPQRKFSQAVGADALSPKFAPLPRPLTPSLERMLRGTSIKPTVPLNDTPIFTTPRQLREQHTVSGRVALTPTDRSTPGPLLPSPFTRAEPTRPTSCVHPTQPPSIIEPPSSTDAQRSVQSAPTKRENPSEPKFAPSSFASSQRYQATQRPQPPVKDIRLSLTSSMDNAIRVVGVDTITTVEQLFVSVQGKLEDVSKGKEIVELHIHATRRLGAQEIVVDKGNAAAWAVCMREAMMGHADEIDLNVWAVV
jgi:hypothetical protein